VVGVDIDKPAPRAVGVYRDSKNGDWKVVLCQVAESGIGAVVKVVGYQNDVRWSLDQHRGSRVGELNPLCEEDSQPAYSRH